MTLQSVLKIKNTKGLHDYTPVTIGQKSYPVTIELKAKKHSSAAIKECGIVLRISRYLSKKEQQDHIDSLLKKITQKIRLARPNWNPLSHLFSSLPHIDLERQEHYLGPLELNNSIHYRIFVRKRFFKNPSIRLLSFHRILISVSSLEQLTEFKENIEKGIYKRIAGQQLPFMYDFVTYLNLHHFREKIHSIRLKNMRSRWGSCSQAGNINLSVRLLFLPLELMEYVCVHELAHLKEMNHSRRFWTWVAKILPDYQDKRLMLNDYCP